MRNIDDDDVCNKSNNQTFQEVLDARLSRRGFLGGGLATAAALSLGGVSALLKAVPASAQTVAEDRAAAARLSRHRRVDRRHGRGAAGIHG